MSTEQLVEADANQSERGLEGAWHKGGREEAEQQGSARCNQVPTCLAGAMAWGWGVAGKAGTG